ncbi:MAG: hypothetical protein DWQ34_15180 [Planctomycetota bacterium]|nr:MAG: hypothetical protein DWQ29_22110 [Planctomycetota bacterium]REJ91294.1 MAG: hypothetical protein DWQ34_15180 [Planctomycetota bacterium]REK31284.1 MAG: hypothetical protein DWQ41_00055 [Planctomycetota bacterium]REK37314.1 MAG: hypothetical protein DWQ45_07660 [Planctomycetota bacterium]
MRHVYGEPGDEAGPESAVMIAYLESRVAANPEDAATWRMLGRAALGVGDDRRALDALSRALELDAQSAAVQYDMAFLLQKLDRPAEAADHFARVVRLAPDSEYAAEAARRLESLPAPEGGSEIVQAGYEIRQFDGTQILEQQNLPPFADVVKRPPPLLLRLEFGALYNSNVALTPTSRNLALNQAGSAQFYFGPQIEYWLVEHDAWRAGALFNGQFTVNESDFTGLNLQSYQPGAFIERSVFLEHTVLVPRIQFVYTLDQFDGTTLANRAAGSALLTSYWDSGSTSNIYWSIDNTDFSANTAAPAFNSRDGVTNAIGASHTHYMGVRYLQSVTAGVDLQHVETDGVNFSFNGVSLFAAANIPILERLSLLLTGGWGYRDYFDAVAAPSPNQNVWQGGARLQYRINEFWSLAGVFNYNRFSSRNAIFDTERSVGGGLLVFEY